MPLTAAEQKELDSLLNENDSLDKVINELTIESQGGVSRETTEPALEGVGARLFPSTAQAVQQGIQPTEQVTFPPEKPGEPTIGGPSGFGALARPEAGAAPIVPLLSDIGSLTTRALDAFKDLATGGGIEGFKATLSDPEAGILKGTRKETEKFYDDRIKESDSAIEKGIFTTLKVLATTGFGIIEDPATIATAIGKVFQSSAKVTGKIASDVKATISSQVAPGGGVQEALEQASKVPVKRIRGAAGTEEELAEEITQKISPTGEKEFLQPLKGKQAQLEEGLVEEGLQGVRIKRPTVEEATIDPLVGGEVIRKVPDPTAKLIDPKTGQEIEFPIEILENAGKQKAFATQFKGQFNKLQKEADQILKTVQGKEVISAKDAIQMKRQFQQVLSDKFGVEGKAVFDNVLKSFSASTRAAIEQAAIKAGKPEYIDIMRELSKSKGLFERSRQVLTGKKKGFDDLSAATAIEKKLNTLMNKFDRPPQQVLEDLDDIFAKAGTPTDFAERANLAAVARKTGIKEKGTPLTSLIATGKSVVIPLLIASSTLTGPVKSAAFLAGMVGSSPLAARAMFKSINWAQAAQKSPKIKAMINSLGKVATSDAAIKLMNKIETEIQKTSPQ